MRRLAELDPICNVMADKLAAARSHFGTCSIEVHRGAFDEWS